MEQVDQSRVWKIISTDSSVNTEYVTVLKPPCLISSWIIAKNRSSPLDQLRSSVAAPLMIRVLPGSIVQRWTMECISVLLTHSFAIWFMSSGSASAKLEKACLVQINWYRENKQEAEEMGLISWREASEMCSAADWWRVERLNEQEGCWDRVDCWPSTLPAYWRCTVKKNQKKIVHCFTLYTRIHRNR